MPKASRLRWATLLSHARPEDLDRCLCVTFGNRIIHLCARCAGLYPALAVGIASRLAGLQAPGWVDSLLGLVIPIVGASAWAVEHSGRPLPKAVRVVSGLFIGVGLGWVLGLHFRSPWPAELLYLGLAMAVVVALGFVGRLARFEPGATVADLLPEDDGDGAAKNSASPPQNEVDPKAS